MWNPFKRKEKPKKRMYSGAQGGRLTSDWITSSSSADVEIKISLKKLRDRSRQLVRDNDYAKQAVRAIKNNVVGPGVGFQSQVKQLRGGKLDSKINDAIEASWFKWNKKENCHTGGSLSFNDIEHLIIGSKFESGEIFVRIISQAMGDSKVPMALEIIEGDLLDENYNDLLQNGNTIKMGVEMNQWGRPQAYHFWSVNPNDIGYQDPSQIPRRRIRVPADEVIHLFHADRPRQTRGVPEFASSIMRMRQMAGYEEAELVSARASASLMGFIESPEGEIPSDGVQDGDRVTDFESGVFKYLGQGEKVTIPNLSRPNGQYDPFMRSQLRGFGAGVGISYETISRDYSQSNYSSTRQALLEDRDNYRVIQALLIRNFHEIIFTKWLDLAVLSGELRLKGYELNPEMFCCPRWMPRGFSWIDPVREVSAFKDAVRCGFMTQGDVIAQAGNDIDDVFRQRAEELEMMEELELVFDTDPSNTDDKGQTQKQPAENDPDGPVKPAETGTA